MCFPPVWTQDADAIPIYARIYFQDTLNWGMFFIMAHIQLIQCVECRMFNNFFFVVSNSFFCDMCLLVSSLSKRVASTVTFVKSLDALGEASKPPTLALEPSQQDKWVATPQHNSRTKANAKACPQEYHSSLLHMSNRFSLLSETPAELWL